MPPRPRPRPRIAVPTTSDFHSSDTLEADAANTVGKPSEDQDDFFVRNKGRSIKDINQRVAQAAATQISPSSDTGSDVSEGEEVNEMTPKGSRQIRQRNLFGVGKPRALPKWAKKGGISTILNVSDDEGIQILSSNDILHSPELGDTPSGKRARSRSRSRSLTPPPELTETERARTQLAIQKVLRNEQEEPLPQQLLPPIEIDDDDDEEGENLDPVLRRIEERVRNRNNYDGQTGVVHSSLGPATVAVHVTWVPHPEEELMRNRPKQSWTFSIGRNESLKVLSSQISGKARVSAKDLVLMREHKQLFTSITPQGLQVWDKVDLEACTQTTYEALRMRYMRSPTPAQGLMTDAAVNHDREGSPHLSETSGQGDDTDMKFKLVVRASGKQSVTLTVRPSTTCGKIVRAFLAVLAKQEGTAPLSPMKSKQVRLCVDGEKQNPDTPISNCDLEDGDMVEVVGL